MRCVTAALWENEFVMAPIESYPAVAPVLPGIPVRDVLADKSRDIWSVSLGTTVYQAIELMAVAEVSAVLVLDGERVAGIVTERDYARKVILKGKSSRNTRVDEIMTANLVTVDPQTTLQECMSLMTTTFCAASIVIVCVGDSMRP